MLAAKSVQNVARSSNTRFSRKVSWHSQILNHTDGTKGRAVAGKLSRLHRKRSVRVIADPMLRRHRRFRFQRFAQQASESGADTFNRFIQSGGAGQTENFFRRRIKPPNNRVLIDGDNAGWNRFQECFGQRFLNRRFLVKKSIFENGRNVFGQRREAFQIPVIEEPPGDTLSKENPADDGAARIKRHDRFGAEHVERAPHDCALPVILSSKKIGA